MIILEKSHMLYDKSGKVIKKIYSDYFDFENKDEALSYIKNHIEKNIEYYVFKSDEFDDDDYDELYICNYLRKEDFK